MLLFSDGLITCLSVFHQSLGLNEPLLSLSASLSFTFCLEFLISLFTRFLILLYTSQSELVLVFLYLL